MLAFAIGLLLRTLFAAQRVTLEVIAASLCGYLLLGVFWADLYSLLELVEPASFAFSSLGAPVVDGDDGLRGLRFGTARFATALYFSYVTLTTLGFVERKTLSNSEVMTYALTMTAALRPLIPSLRPDRLTPERDTVSKGDRARALQKRKSKRRAKSTRKKR